MASSARKTVYGLGAIMLPASLAVFMQRDTNWFSSHTGVSHAIYAVNVIFCILAIFVWTTGPSDGPVSSPTTTIISPTISPQINPIFNNYVTATPTATPAPAPVKREGLELVLIPHGDQSSQLGLEVKSKVDSTLKAEMRLISRSDGQPVSTRPYAGQWQREGNARYVRGTTSYTASKVAVRGEGPGRLLEIAIWEIDGSEARMDMVGIDAWILWERRPAPHEGLPFITLQIEFFSEDFAGSVLHRFKVGPKEAYGPLGMTEVVA